MGSDLCYNHYGPLHPLWGELRASDCAAAVRRARPRCCAPLMRPAPPPAGELRASGLRYRCAVSSTLGASHPLMRPAPLHVAGFGLRCRCAACSSSVLRTLDAACPAAHGGQALRYACAWLRASWLSAISGASRPSASLGRGLRSAGTERLDDPNKFGSSNSGLRAGTV